MKRILALISALLVSLVLAACQPPGGGAPAESAAPSHVMEHTPSAEASEAPSRSAAPQQSDYDY